jgi:hypothetical protein
VRDPAVVSRQIGDEAVLVHPVQGMIRVLNAVGARVWELADGRRSIESLAAQIADEYNVPPEQVEADVLSFCDDLERRGVLRTGRPG